MLVKGMLLFLIFTITGTKCELQDDFSEQESYPLELSRTYRYNHPPLFEAFVESDPDDIEVRIERDVTNDGTNNFDISETLDPLTSKEINNGNKYKETKFVESSAPEKIPVSVIYEPQANTESSNNKVNSTVVKPKRRKRPKHSQPINKEKKSEPTLEVTKPVTEVREVITEKLPPTSPTPRTIVPKVFTKRPPEDNPIVKKIRQRDPVVKIVDEKNYVFAHSGNFHYSFEGGDGTKISSQGELKSFDNDKTGEAVVGSVFYKDNDGNDVSLSYTADENGYRPQGAHLPTPPPIPPAIARALKYLATATTPEPVTKPAAVDT